MEEERIQISGESSTQIGRWKEVNRVRTLRGKLTAEGSGDEGKAEAQLILNDQLINRGLKVTGFFVWPDYVGNRMESKSYNAILSYAQLNTADVVMDASDNTQIGWVFNEKFSKGADPAGVFQAISLNAEGFVDPDHIINRDLFVSLRKSTAGVTYNYMVVCEMVELTDAEAIVTIIKENSQSVE